MAAAAATEGVGAEFSVTDPSAQENVVVKIGMVGDAGVGQQCIDQTALSFVTVLVTLHVCRQNKFNGQVRGGNF